MSGRKRKGYDRTVYRSFALIMQFGINMLVPICIMSALGIYIDKKLGTGFVMIILFFVGAFAGARNVYRMAKYNLEDKDDKLRYNSKSYEGKAKSGGVNGHGAVAGAAEPPEKAEEKEHDGFPT